MLEITTLDLNFQNRPGIIAAYLIPYSEGAVLVETGPGSTFDALQVGLAAQGFSLSQVTDVLLTHIHLDHAGAAGRLAEHGARIHVHPRGLQHLADPTRLLASAGRIYGDRMEALWGEMLPVPPNQLRPLQDGEAVAFGDLQFTAHDTPGHASHHLAYMLEDVCFCGDIGGIRLPGPRHIVLPMPPPEFHLESWMESRRRLAGLGFRRIAPTHFGLYDDAPAHLEMLEKTLQSIGYWIDQAFPNEDEQDLASGLESWMEAQALAHGLTPEQHRGYEIANPTQTSAWGISRYWNKFRAHGGRS